MPFAYTTRSFKTLFRFAVDGLAERRGEGTRPRAEAPFRVLPEREMPILGVRRFQMTQGDVHAAVPERVERRRFQLLKRRVGLQLRDAGVELGHRVRRDGVAAVAGGDGLLAARVGLGDAQGLAVAVKPQRADAGGVLLAGPDAGERGLLGRRGRIQRPGQLVGAVRRVVVLDEIHNHVHFALHIRRLGQQDERNPAVGNDDAELAERAVAAVALAVVVEPELVAVACRPVVRAVVHVDGVARRGGFDPLLAHDAPAVVYAAAAQHFGERHEVGRREVEPHAAERDPAERFPARPCNPQRAEEPFLQIVGQRHTRAPFHRRRADAGRTRAVYESGARLVRHRRL